MNYRTAAHNEQDNISAGQLPFNHRVIYYWIWLFISELCNAMPIPLRPFLTQRYISRGCTAETAVW